MHDKRIKEELPSLSRYYAVDSRSQECDILNSVQIEKDVENHPVPPAESSLTSETNIKKEMCKDSNIHSDDYIPVEKYNNFTKSRANNSSYRNRYYRGSRTSYSDIRYGRDRPERQKTTVNTSHQHQSCNASASNKHGKNFGERFRYGNYDFYYGYRNQNSEDSRLICMKKEWFVGKEVLDIGCNTGQFTLAIARDLFPKSIIGIDIDGSLVTAAMKNIRHYLTDEHLNDSVFPTSLITNYGPFAEAFLHGEEHQDAKFPYNVAFVQGNYVLDSDELVEMQDAHFDTILCLSLTKWIHLNWGDDGIKKLFRRIYAHLRPGGCMILEAQPWKTYGKRKRATEIARRHYDAISLFPEKFNEYLLKDIGFKTCEIIDIPAHCAKGFRRPLYLFIKESSVGDKMDAIVPKHIWFQGDEHLATNCSDMEELSD